MNRTLLIDADILVVSTCAACEQEIDMGDDEWQLYTDLKDVKDTILKAIKNLEEHLDADASVLCLSRGETFRHRIYPEYKGQRGRKPVGTAEVKRWMIAELGGKLIDGIEADDTMGILATNPRIIKGEKIICSQDKDMLTIPNATVYREGELIEVSEEYAELNWLTQTLTGDSTDNYPGCPGVGPATAEAALKDLKGWEQYEHVYASGKRKGETEMRWRTKVFETRWEVVVSLFEKAGLTEEDAILQAQLARILRTTDYDFKAKEPILWRPQ